MSDGYYERAGETSAVPTGMMVNPAYGSPWLDQHERGQLYGPAHSLDVPQYVADPNYVSPAQYGGALPDWAAATGHEVVPTFDQKWVGGREREGGHNVSTGAPTGYMYDNGQSTYVYTDLNGKILHSDPRQNTGWLSFRDGIATPAAIAAAIYFTGGAAADAMGGGAAAAGTGAAASGTGAAAAGASLAGDAMMPGALASGISGAGTASGLAGSLGMNAGYAATALNAGALNTGMGLMRGQNIGDALQTGAKGALLSPVSGYVGNAVGGGALGTIAGNAASGGVKSLLGGGDVWSGVRDGAVNGAVGAAGNYIGGLARGASSGLGNTGASLIGNVANQATQSALRGNLNGNNLANMGLKSMMPMGINWVGNQAKSLFNGVPPAEA